MPEHKTEIIKLRLEPALKAELKKAIEDGRIDNISAFTRKTITQALTQTEAKI
jgi:Arc/MetJ-type ribon-helix-helix transcriptional regulator